MNLKSFWKTDCSLLNKSGSHSEIKAAGHILDIHAGRGLWGLFSSLALQVPYLCYFFFQAYVSKKREEALTAIHLWCSVVLTENRQGNKVFMLSSGINKVVIHTRHHFLDAFQHPNTSVSAQKFQSELLTEILSQSSRQCHALFCPAFCLSDCKAPSWSSDRWKLYFHPSEDACKHYASIQEYKTSVNKNNNGITAGNGNNSVFFLNWSKPLKRASTKYY